MAPPKPKVSVPKIPSVPKLRPLYPCIGACGREVSQRDQLCSGCKKAKQIAIAANAERQIKTKRASASLASGATLGLLWVGDEALLLQYRCINPLCKKPVIVHGKCYKCATGLEKTLKCLPVIEYHTEQLAS